MPKRYSSTEIQKVFQKLKYTFIRQKGSHAIFKNSDGFVVVLQMNKKQIPPGTFSKILRDLNISLSDFDKLLKK